MKTLHVDYSPLCVDEAVDFIFQSGQKLLDVQQGLKVQYLIFDVEHDYDSLVALCRVFELTCELRLYEEFTVGMAKQKYTVLDQWCFAQSKGGGE